MRLAKSWRPTVVACAVLLAPLTACDGGKGSASESGPEFRTQIVEQIRAHFASTQPPKRRFLIGRLEYAAGEHDLPRAARPVIREIGAILAAHPESVVRVESFAIETGTSADEHLAARRAHQVAKVLEETGMIRHHILSASSDPISSADAPALGPVENGRTDIIVYTKKGFEAPS